MTLESEFPLDPFHPSLPYAATNQIPVTCPWTTQPIKLGTSLMVSRTTGVKSEFSDKTAFSLAALQTSKIYFTSGSSGQVVEATSIGSASAAEHVTLSVAASIGSKHFGVSGQAHFEEQVMSNSNTNKSSRKTSYRNGQVAFQQIPPLSADAVNILRSSCRPFEAFQEKYGEYFVAAYFIGGSNAHLFSLGTTGATSNKKFDGSLTVKAGPLKKTTMFSEHEDKTAQAEQGGLCGFDTIDRWDMDSTMPGKATLAQLNDAAATNGRRAWTMEKRLEQKARLLGLELQQNWQVTLVDCEKFCTDGLVVDLLLLPYASLWDFKAALLAGPTK